ncbi:MAG TPA: hypothetical protein VGL46_02195 [Pseudonocardiaceae bacterium]
MTALHADATPITGPAVHHSAGLHFDLKELSHPIKQLTQQVLDVKVSQRRVGH